MEVLTDSDASASLSEFPSSSPTSLGCSVLSENSSTILISQAGSVSDTGTPRTTRGTSSTSSDYERITSLQSIQGSYSSSCGGMSSTDHSNDDDDDSSQSPVNDFIRQCCQTVERNSQEKSAVSGTKSDVTSPMTDVVEFCTECIRIIQSGNNSEPLGSVCPMDSSRNISSEENIVIRPIVIEKLKVERLLHNMRKVTQLPELQSIKDCPTCRHKKMEMDQKTFIQDSVRRLTNRLTEEKLQKHLLEMDPVNCIGDLASGLPRPSDPPEEIWKRLLDK